MANCGGRDSTLKMSGPTGQGSFIGGFLLASWPHSRSLDLVTLLHGDGSPTDLLHEVVRALELRGEVQHLLVIHFLFGHARLPNPRPAHQLSMLCVGAKGGGGAA